MIKSDELRLENSTASGKQYKDKKGNKMEKPKLTDYCKLPTSTSTDLRLNYDYEQYSIALENYIKYLKNEINKYIQKR